MLYLDTSALVKKYFDRIGEPITLATFDRGLWRAAKEAGLEAFPASL